MTEPWKFVVSNDGVKARQAIGTLGIPTDYDTSGEGDYRVGDQVRFTDPEPSSTEDTTGLYRCITDHTSGSPKDQPSRWELVSAQAWAGLTGKPEWINDGLLQVIAGAIDGGTPSDPGISTIDGGAPNGAGIEEGIAFRMMLRRGTSSGWTSANPVLSPSEFGFETNTKRLKIGDGATAWNSLPYLDSIIAAGSTIDTPILTNPNMSAVKGSNGNKVFDFFDLASAVNYLRVINSVAGGFLTISAQGTDNDITINVVTKGAGAFLVNSVRVRTILETAGTRSGTTYTLAGGDERTIQEFTHASGCTVTVPLNATWAAPVGCVIPLCQMGAGQVTVSPAGGVTVRSKGGALKTAAQYSVAYLRKQATDTWILWGDITT